MLDQNTIIYNKKIGVFFKTHWLFIFLFFIIFILRALILIYGSIPIHDNDAQRGIMAKHIYELKRFYLYEINEPIHGGAVIEALISALLFWINGEIYDNALHISGFIISLFALISFYAFLFLCFGSTIASLSSLLFALATPLIYLNFSIWGGYFALFCLLPWIFYFEGKIITDKQEKLKNFFLLGFLLGFGLWILEFMIPFIVCFFVIFLFSYRTRGLLKSIPFFLTGFIIGYLPSIIYNFTNNFSNWNFILFGRRVNIFSIGLGKGLLAPVYIILYIFKAPGYLSFIPRFFEPDNDWAFSAPVSVVSYVQCVITIVVIIHLVISGRKKFFNMLISFFRCKPDFFKYSKTDQYLFIIILNVILFLPFSITLRGYRYFLFAYPWFFLFFVILFFKFLKRSKFFKVVGYTLICIFIFFDIHGYWKTLTKDDKYTLIDFYIAENGNLRPLFIDISNKEVKNVISFLQEKQIYNIYTPTLTEFLFRYMSRETVNTAAFFFEERYPEVAKNVKQADVFAIITSKVNPMTLWLMQELSRRKIQYKTKIIGEFVVFYPLNRAYLK